MDAGWDSELDMGGAAYWERHRVWYMSKIRKGGRESVHQTDRGRHSYVCSNIGENAAICLMFKTEVEWKYNFM